MIFIGYKGLEEGKGVYSQHGENAGGSVGGKCI